jgi:hypothetical protein
MEWTFPWVIQRTQIIQKQSTMVKPCISVKASVEGFASYKDRLDSFRNHYAILEATVQFFISVLFLVQAIWRKFEWGFGDIATSF